MKKRRTTRILAALSIGLLLAALSSFVRPEVGEAQSCFYCDQVWNHESGYWHEDFPLFYNNWHDGGYHSSWTPGSCANWHANYDGGGGGGGGGPGPVE